MRLPESSVLQQRQGDGPSAGGDDGGGGGDGASSTSLGSITPTSTPTSTSTSSPSATSNPESKHSSAPPTVGIIVGVVAGVLGLLLLFFALRQTRRKHKNPKYIPKPLKQVWQKWEPRSWSSHRRLPDTNEHLEPISTIQSRASVNTAGPTSTIPTTAATAAGGVDRNTSVRSVMTLPAYNPAPNSNEQVLGREGERGGIDVVVEQPETIDEEEAQREAEMEALYQVRLARRRENEEREERRQQRREARERGDTAALREIQARARAGNAASAGRSLEELRAEHERVKKERSRAVSSVSYADLGVARHDGTRLRASSIESEREGLLGDAASIAASSHYHRRERSASSVISIDTNNSDFPSPGLPRARAESPLTRASTRQSQSEGLAGSSPEMIEHEDVPPNSPPEYENIALETPHSEEYEGPPPGYTSPVAEQGEGRAFFESRSGSGSRSSRGVGGTPQLPSLRLSNLPSIQVDPSSPVVRSIDEEGEHHQ
ncbi:hypothetical protein LHYA1_G005269 [Lachnellula hyalina]|uniref:Uncharacterized protein n=1 Tax=Lachnellula hyalina TaxID=1316788 RepID=A0A8H8R278_9HELO|nr:uncharacterized protein LHYA1_G005269 [Lachnellula hyalina]TVY27152.1 hypothetical protein LHYA1_G005269 [Lachnellula hyalina]